MFRDAKLSSGFAVDDLQRAKVFYGETLGLEVVEVLLGVKGSDVPRGLEIHVADGTTIGIYARKDHLPATFTVLGIHVHDIEAAIDELTARGVRFESYDEPIKTDAKGIHRNPSVLPVAWFKDPAGNILSLNEDEN
jgi:predicted enzyme related to lactoylglutathione lyase